MKVMYGWLEIYCVILRRGINNSRENQETETYEKKEETLDGYLSLIWCGYAVTSAAWHSRRRLK
jgi:hypothetical protein